MLRPVQRNEVDFLARLFVKISVAANAALGLSSSSPSSAEEDGGPPASAAPAAPAASASSASASSSANPPGSSRGRSRARPSLGHPFLDAARDAAARRGLRVNLRPLAEKATLLWLPALVLSLRLALWLLRVVWEVLTAPYEPGEWELQQQQQATMAMSENE